MKKTMLVPTAAAAMAAILFLPAASAHEMVSGGGIDTNPVTTSNVTMAVYAANPKTGAANYTQVCGYGHNYYGTLVYQSGDPGDAKCSGNADMLKIAVGSKSITIYNRAALVPATTYVPGCGGYITIAKSGDLSYTPGGSPCSTAKPATK